MSTLEIMSGKASGTTVDLSQFAGQEKITLGNRRTASVVIKDPWVSFMHAVITQDGSSFRIADKRSKAGTFVNGNKIGASGTPLKNGDTIALGKTQLRFSASGSAPASAPAAAAAAAGGPFSAPAAQPASGSPFTPFAPADAPAPSSDTSKLESDLKALRAAVAQREKALAEANARMREMEAGGGDPEVAKRLKEAESQARQLQHQLLDTTSKAKIRFEELTRLNQTLETRLAQGGAGNVVQLEKELAHLREEGRARIEQLTRELNEAQAGAGAASSEALEAAEAKAKEAEGKAQDAEARAAAAQEQLDALKNTFGQLQSEKMDLEMKVEDLEEGLSKIGGAGDEVAAMEGVISKLNTELRASKDELIQLRNKLLEAEKVAAESARAPAPPPPPPAPAPAGDGGAVKALEAQLAELQSKLQAAEARATRAEEEAKAAKQAAQAAEEAAEGAAAAAAAAPAPPPPPAPAAAGDPALEARVKELQAENESLLKDLEEINEDMLAQEEEYMERIQELEDKLANG